MHDLGHARVVAAEFVECALEQGGVVEHLRGGQRSAGLDLVRTQMLAQPLLRRVERLVGSRNTAAVILALLLFLTIVLPLYLGIFGVWAGVRSLAMRVSGEASWRDALMVLAALDANGAAGAVPASFDEVRALLERYGSEVLQWSVRVAGIAADGVLTAVVYLAGVFILLVEGDVAVAWLIQHIPLRHEHLRRLGAATVETGQGLLFGVGMTTATQGLVATLAYAALGVPRAWLLGPLTGVASIVPLVGSALVWGPVAIGLYAAGHATKAGILTLLGVAVIGTIDNALRPVFARLGSLRLHVVLLFVSALGGLALLGAKGATLGPLVVRLALEALAMQREERARTATPPPL